MLFAVTSSPLSWTTGDGFSLVGFSLGGGICVDFASTHSQFVNSIVLLAPGGLLRRVPAGYDDHYIQHPNEPPPTPTHIRDTVAGMLEIELNNPKVLAYTTSKPCVSPPISAASMANSGWKPAELDMAGLIQWQWDYHKGHIHAIATNARDGPIQHCHEMWRKLAAIFTGQNPTKSLLRGSDMLVILGSKDVIVNADETEADILSFMPSQHVIFLRYPDGHGFVYPRSSEIANQLANFWGLE